MINKKINLTGFIVVLLGLIFLAMPGPGQAAEADFPAPTLLVPAAGTPLGQDRVWVGGVVKNNSILNVFVDGEQFATFPVKNHISGTASFGVELKDLAWGGHVVTATAQNHQGKVSPESNILSLEVSALTPAPTLKRPVVNGDAGIERPFIVGLVKNGLEVSIVLDNRIVARLRPEIKDSGTASFAWQPERVLSLGRHKIEAFASDKGKLSNNAKALYWPVGDIGAVAGEAVDKKEPITIKVDDNKESPVKTEAPLTVKENLEAPQPPVVADDAKGRVVASDDQGEGEKKLSQADGVKQLAPGAVVRVPTKADSGRGFTINNSLLVGIAILVFLLISIVVWYIQEKKEHLGNKVASLFREEAGGVDDENKAVPVEVKKSALLPTKENNTPTDLPPPPPPVF